MGDGARLAGIAPGEIVAVENEHGRDDPTMILGRCPKARGYYCLTHRVRLANGYQLQAHIETTAERAHWLASWCYVHGLESLPNSEAEAVAASLARRRA